MTCLISKGTTTLSIKGWKLFIEWIKMNLLISEFTKYKKTVYGEKGALLCNSSFQSKNVSRR